ncbi:glycosyltransferase family 2 protein [Roseitranquillus sediminis]|uniref:glycosyltransferase family 2 protein n=1 Tax=Roseitranquillus sediminis TaxID=2809051 RepID=UPI001D0CAF9F|nr:glycosyltransferase family 2 protein [Roseitranquillus sediminis]MBM9593915.1 glycosyltransferase family 2 protein [Roseitranquillus sediminis]
MSDTTDATNGRPRAAIVIPHYDDVARLGRCLDALAAQDRSGIELVVVDNGSTQSLDAVRAAHPWARFVTEAQKGAAAARNRGVAETTATGLIFLDADCVPAPDWLAAARRAVRFGTVTGGRVDVFDETEGPRSGPQAFETVFAFDQRAYVEQKGFSVTANLVTTRAVFEATGPFVPGLSEDLDWCRRAVAGGARLVYDDALRVAHPSRGDWASLAKKWRRLSAEGFATDGQGARALWATKALAMPASVLAHAPRVLRDPRLSAAEKGRALGTLTRLRLARAGWMLRQAATGRP